MTLNEQKEELKTFLLSNQNKGQSNLKWFKNRYNELYNDFLTWNFPADFKFNQRLYHYLNEDKELKLGLCLICGNRCDYLNFKLGYRKYCSNKCSNACNSKKEKSKQTKLEKYGDENYHNVEKMKTTKLERYGDESYVNFEKAKQTKLERYGDENYNNSEKQKETCNERYGGIGNASEELREKQKKTNLERYGDENYRNDEKSKQTRLSRYGDENYNNSDKQKKTCLEIYGVDNVFKSEEIKDKIKESNLEKFGTEYYFQSEEYRQKYEDYEWVQNKMNQYKQTNNKRYGVDFYTQSDEFKEKYKNYEWVKSIQEKVYNTKKKNHTFNSSNIEDEFADWLKENNFKFERQHRSEEYPFNCDFYLNDYDLYIEIQGTWCHGYHPFDENNEEDRMTLENWKLKNSDYYKKAINVWTKRDVKKRNIAKENNLNYLEIFSCKLDDCINIIKNYFETVFINNKIKINN